MTIVKKTFQYGQHPVTIETGSVARQATGAVSVRMGDTVILVTAVGVENDKTERDFFPLTVNYQERSYAAGKIPGGYFKREGRPSEKETLISRLIDRPLRPLFPEGFSKEVQIIATVLSLDDKVPADIPAIIGASAALAISGIPFNGPVAAARVGFKDGQYLLNLNAEGTKESDLDLVVAGTKSAVLMVESEANMLAEEVMLGAVLFGHTQMQVAIQAIEELAKEGGKAGWKWQAPSLPGQLVTDMTTKVETAIADAYQIREKAARVQKLREIKEQAMAEFSPENNTPYKSADVATIFSDIERRLVRSKILKGEPRIDGRDNKTVRPIRIATGILPRAHGSALFTRGETQALVVATLGTERDAQSIDDIAGEYRDQFMLHYNFPPYSVGEVGMVGSPKRREIGHGKLAKRALAALIPSVESFPYTLRVVSEITESNGSSSMASVCGTSLALMDAGVPLKAPVAGIAMGLIKEKDQFAVLTDILGDEDHLGDMDFKVAGTKQGVTALQMDIKIDGITADIMEKALAQARDARLHILDIMDAALSTPRDQLSEFAPRIITFKINPDKIREVIGKGGVTIRELTESTGTTIDITDDGTVKVYAVDAKAGQTAQERIMQITEEVEIGKIYTGTVAKLVDFGAFVNFMHDKSGLVHISQISHERIENVFDVLQEGQTVKVKVLEIDRQGRVRLSMKEVEQQESDNTA